VSEPAGIPLTHADFFRVAEVFVAAMAEAGYPIDTEATDPEVNNAPKEIIDRAMQLALMAVGLPPDAWVLGGR
jgi:hypothetical protein